MRDAALNVALALLFVAVYSWAYVAFLNFYFAYVGFDLFQRSAGFIATSVAIAVLPVLCYRGVRAISSVLAVLIYLALYVPIIMTFALGATLPLEEITLIQFTFMAGMAMIFLSDAIIIRSPVHLMLGFDLMPAVLWLTAVAVVYMVVIYHGNMRFVDFGDELYAQRAANDSLGAGLVTRYLSSWLSTVLVPLCLAYGLTIRKHWYTTLGTAACLILYMAAANKIIILLPFVFVGFYLTFRERLRWTFPISAVGLSVLIAVLLLVASETRRIVFIATSILLYRTIGNGGQITMAYYDFFSFHPQTHYSHVGGLKFFSRPYPYGNLGIGEVIGQHFWSPFMNANANFWATDGIAAMGLTGVIIVSLLCVALFLAMNAVSSRHDPLFVALCFLPFLITLLNQSLFSSFWSGGAFFLMLFMLLNPRIGATVGGEELAAVGRADA
jgi:hypothetical protein